ncbi:MAG TPA: hypothetical protein VJW93_13920 [Candidatus Acidoferrales bacterium]|nr:hypothetical protein [Candidatus Acidoferrales bacterium]
MKGAICTVAAAILAMGVLAMRAGSQAKAAGGFDQLRTLIGAWEATSGDGEKFTTTIRAVSNGTALEETFNNSKDSEMVTLYTPDGNKVALTHYCSMGNQPRMETSAVGSNAKQFDFAYIGATNLASESDVHMHHVLLQIADGDHFSETWTMLANGKEMNETFHFVRKKV